MARKLGLKLGQEAPEPFRPSGQTQIAGPTQGAAPVPIGATAAAPSALATGITTGGKILAALPGIGTIGGLLLQGGGMWLQYRHQKKVKEEADHFTRVQNAIRAREARRQWSWMEDEREYQRGQDFMSNVFNLMKTEKSFESDLLNMWRTAA